MIKLDLLDIKFHNLFQFVSYGVIIIPQPGLRVLRVNHIDLRHFLFFSFLINFFPLNSIL